MSVIAAVDEAVIGRLQADVILQGLAPGGVHRNVAPEDVVTAAADGRVFVTVKLQIGLPTYEQGGVAYFRDRYTVRAVARTENAAGAKAAADRFHALLHETSYAIAGSVLMNSELVERFDDTERDGPFEWQHIGGDYEVWTSPL